MNSVINDNAPLIDEKLIQRISKLSPSLLCDALGDFGAMDHQIKPIWTGAKVLGTVLTVKLPAGDNLMLHLANCQVGPGYVLVVDTGNCKTRAVWGNMMTRAAMKAGGAGTVVDGVVRDVDDIAVLQYPVFALGATPQGPRRDEPGSINVPILCGGVEVEPGDLVFGDADGVVVVARNLLEETVSKAEKKLAAEDKRLAEIAEGEIAPQWLAGKLEELGL